MNEVSPQTQHWSWNGTSPLLAKSTFSAEPHTTSGKESFSLAVSNALFLIEPFSLQFSESCAIVQEGLLLAYSYMAPAGRTCEPLILLCWMYAADTQIVFPLHLIPYQGNQFHCHLNRWGTSSSAVAWVKNLSVSSSVLYGCAPLHGCPSHGTQLKCFIQTPENSPQELLGFLLVWSRPGAIVTGITQPPHLSVKRRLNTTSLTLRHPFLLFLHVVPFFTQPSILCPSQVSVCPTLCFALEHSTLAKPG